MKEKAYHEKVNITNAVRLREQLQLLPKFCREYFVGIEPTTSSRTRLAYSYDLGIFFEYIHDNNPVYKKMLENGKKQYAFEIIQLAKEISEEAG